MATRRVSEEKRRNATPPLRFVFSSGTKVTPPYETVSIAGKPHIGLSHREFPGRVDTELIPRVFS